MGEKNRRPALELDQDLSVTRASWRFERIGWIGLVLFVAGALLGVLGPGPLSDARAGEADAPVRVDYERFAHFESEAELGIQVRPPASGPFELWMSSDYLRHLEVRGVTPPPMATRVEPDRLVYR